jgi:hypothetical protein
MMLNSILGLIDLIHEDYLNNDILTREVSKVE